MLVILGFHDCIIVSAWLLNIQLIEHKTQSTFHIIFLEFFVSFIYIFKRLTYQLTSEVILQMFKRIQVRRLTRSFDYINILLQKKFSRSYTSFIDRNDPRH